MAYSRGHTYRDCACVKLMQPTWLDSVCADSLASLRSEHMFQGPNIQQY